MLRVSWQMFNLWADRVYTFPFFRSKFRVKGSLNTSPIGQASSNLEGRMLERVCGFLQTQSSLSLGRCKSRGPTLLFCGLSEARTESFGVVGSILEFRVYSVSLGSIDGFPVEKPHMIGASKTGYHYPTRAALFC